jgi:peroxiredoxin
MGRPMRGGITAFCFLITAFFSADIFSENSAGKPELVEKRVPDFTLETFSGQRRNLGKLIEGKRALIYFWATWCPNCHEKLKYFQDIKQQYEDDGIALIIVNIGDQRKNVERYMKKHQISLDVFLDPERSLQKPYHLIGIPTLVYVDHQGMVVNVRHDLPEGVH